MSFELLKLFLICMAGVIFSFSIYGLLYEIFDKPHIDKKEKELQHKAEVIDFFINED